MSKPTLVYDDGQMRSDLGATERVSPQDLHEAHKNVLTLLKSGEQGWLDVLEDQPYLKSIEDCAKKFSKFKNCLVLGIGGSDLGTRALYAALGNKTKGTELWFSGDTTDPDEISRVFDQIPWDKTCINVISKSGRTLETMAAFFEARQRMEKKIGSKKTSERIICTTDPEHGDLRELALKKGYAILEIPQNIGGRFSVLTAVGLFPLALAGVKVKDLLKGAIAMRDDWMEEHGSAHFIDRFAGWQVVHETRKKRNIHVLFAYAGRLSSFANWWRQLWAESLGKAQRRNGQKKSFGPTPVVSVGPTDQHSQVQLYRDGPDDKIYTFLTVEGQGSKLRVPASAKTFGPMSAAAGKTFAKLLEAEADGTFEALVDAKRPAGRISLPKVDENSLGALIVFFELATAVAGELYEINAYDQPGVEAGKLRTQQLLTG
ncbi:MAG: glucose-6-phosphate isomerase [Patescibacteria group bacterium]|jgi:glucose-6-phosphate isomerase